MNIAWLVIKKTDSFTISRGSNFAYLYVDLKE